MKQFITIIKYDYLQRTRSYAFLITLCFSLALAYSFVPEPNANYYTIRIGDYIGYYNAAWFGYVTAIMASIFLSLMGFFLINNSIKKDIDTKVGHIVAASSIDNFNYLFSKVISNFLVLLTIVMIIFGMSILLFVLYNDGFPFELIDFVLPYVLITIPAMFLISVVAVCFEVILGNYSVIQNIVYIVLFMTILVAIPKDAHYFYLDPIGTNIVTHEMEKSVKEMTNADEIGMSIGYIFGDNNKMKRFTFEGVTFPFSFVMSRVMWMIGGIGLIPIVSFFFHRFDTKERYSKSKSTTKDSAIKAISEGKEIILSSLPKLKVNYGIIPLFKAELRLLIRDGNRWLWPLNAIGLVLLVIVPLREAHLIVLPILWFLQVSRLSGLTTKEQTFGTYYFSSSSLKPLSRLLLTQLMVGVIFILLLSAPLLIRLALVGDIIGIVSILLGGLFIVLLSSSLGIISNGKKLFEVLFFLITYANINGISFFDYYGAMTHGPTYHLALVAFIIGLGILSFMARGYEMKR